MLDFILKEKLLKVTPRRVYKFVTNVVRYKKLNMPPVIIGGAPRSGTTLLLSILGSHPAIHAVSFETQAFSLIRKHQNSALNHKENMTKFKRYILLEHIKSSAKMWCEKTPNNIHHLDHILKEFNGRVKIIHIVRDGRDVITSKHPTKPDTYYTDTETWLHNTNLGLSKKELPNVYTVRYEDIIDDFKDTITKVLHFLGLEWDVTIEQFHANSTVKKNVAFEGGKVAGLYNKSKEKWLKPEHKAVIEAFYKNEKATALLKELGYEL